MLTNPACGGSILLSRAELAVPARDKLHPLIRSKVNKCITALAIEADHLGSAEYIGYSERRNLLCSVITEHGQDVYSFPYLDPEYCTALVHELHNAGYEVNEAEEPEARIPEIVLTQRSKPLHDCFAVLWEHVAVPLAQLLWNLEPAVLASVQAAEYRADEIAGTALHHDQDSDVTLVVNLGTPHEGGGTAVHGGIFSDGVVSVPSLPVGHAMFFLGRTKLHQGLPVTAGVRTLLVHWATL